MIAQLVNAIVTYIDPYITRTVHITRIIALCSTRVLNRARGEYGAITYVQSLYNMSVIRSRISIKTCRPIPVLNNHRVDHVVRLTFYFKLASSLTHSLTHSHALYFQRHLFLVDLSELRFRKPLVYSPPHCYANIVHLICI